jgi:hypothetical protein
LIQRNVAASPSALCDTRLPIDLDRRADKINYNCVLKVKKVRAMAARRVRNGVDFHRWVSDRPSPTCRARPSPERPLIFIKVST